MKGEKRKTKRSQEMKEMQMEIIDEKKRNEKQKENEKAKRSIKDSKAKGE